ncbi:hypothetical protein ACVWZK_007932 [Bradyrhizobium sp. GM0.4]
MLNRIDLSVAPLEAIWGMEISIEDHNVCAQEGAVAYSDASVGANNGATQTAIRADFDGGTISKRAQDYPRANSERRG